MKGTFLEFQVIKGILVMVDDQQREILHQRTQMSQAVASSKRCQILDDNHEGKHEPCLDLIHRESPFNFIKIYLLSYFTDYIREFGMIPIYSSGCGELAHKEQIKEGWRRWNQNDARRQIVHS